MFLLGRSIGTCRPLTLYTNGTGPDRHLDTAGHGIFPHAPRRARRPFPDEVARALADEANLVRLAQVTTPTTWG